MNQRNVMTLDVPHDAVVTLAALKYAGRHVECEPGAKTSWRFLPLAMPSIPARVQIVIDARRRRSRSR